MKARVYQLARELKISSDALVNIITSLGEEVKSHMSAIEDDVVVKIRARIAEERAAVKRDSEKQARMHQEIQKKEELRAPVSTPPPAAPAPAPQAPAPQSFPSAPRPERTISPPPQAPPSAPARPSLPTPSRPSMPSSRPGPGPGQGSPGQGSPGQGRPSVFPRRGGPSGGRRKPKQPQVDQQAVRDSVRRTLATLDGGRSRGGRRRRRSDEAGIEEENRSLRIHEFATVAELASVMEVKPNDVIAACLQLGIMANINRRLDRDAITAVMDEFGFEPEFQVEFGDEELAKEEEHAEEFAVRPRAPIVTVMGHVDHGKTSLLDHVRKTRVIDTESGGITQHIGAYLVRLPEGDIAFLDTPGHEAFTAMRARGAQVTDLVVLVVAADDRVRPQTVEAINHAKAADVPIIVAINKIDLANANPDRIKKELADNGVLIEEWGGKVGCVEISAKHGQNVDKLLERILLEAELLELKSEPDRPAKGVVIEAKRDPGRGVVATVLVQNGTLSVGDTFVCGPQYGKVRAMVDELGQRQREAPPSTPVEVLGWGDVPQAGDAFAVMRNEGKAREIASHRSAIAREHRFRLASQSTSLLTIQERIKRGELKELCVVLKADVGGSVEVLRDTLTKLSTDEVKVRIIHSGVGLISEGDVLLAVASGAIIVGFHTRADAKAHQLSLTEKVDVRLYRVIYDVEKDIKDAMSGLLAPEKVEKISGSAEVRRVFHISKVGSIAGCFVVSGTIRRGERARIYRGVDVVWDGKFGSLKRVKDDVREVSSGFECGIGLDGFDDIKEGDVIEAYTVEEVARKID